MKKVVVHFLNGKEKTGRALFFNVQKQTFPFQSEEEGGKVDLQTVRLEDVKKILFLKEESGSGSLLHRETIEQSTFASTVAFKLTVELRDGEVLIGSSLKYNPNDKGFFIIPLNPADRCERIYINARCVKKVDQKKLLGRILLDEKKITPEQLREASRIQEENRTKKIGAIMVEESMINQAQLDESLKKQKERNRKLGEILVEAGYITREQLEEALRIQQTLKKKKLGQILVELKYVLPNDICLALASQLGCPWVDLSAVDVPPEMMSLLPAEIEKKYEIVPVEKKEENVLVVASPQPQDPELQRELLKLSPWKFEVVIAFDGYIDSILHKFFPN